MFLPSNWSYVVGIGTMTPLIQIENKPILQTKSVKFLGITMDQNLTWSEHEDDREEEGSKKGVDEEGKMQK